MKRNLLFPLVSICFGLVVALVLAELLLRVTGSAPTSALLSVTTKEFERIPGVWSPGQAIVQRDIKELPYEVNINWAGYRGRDFEQTKVPGELRILMSGDSFTFGTYVDDDDTLPSQLEQQLTETCSAQPVTVLNAAVGGSTIVGQTELIQRGMKLNPDLVVLVFHDNDINDLNSPIWEEMARNRELKDSLFMSVFWPVLRKTALWNFALRVRGAIRVDESDESATGNLTPEIVNSRADLGRIYGNKLRELATSLAKAGQPFVFVTYPGHRPVLGDKARVNLVEMGVEAGNSSGTPTLNLLPVLRSTLSTDVERGYLLPHNGHPSKVGHRIAAQAVSKFLLTQPVVAAACKTYT